MRSPLASSTWTETRVAELKRLRDKQLTSSQIAYELGGVSRCAVIGKLSRLGLNVIGVERRPETRPRKSYLRTPRLNRHFHPLYAEPKPIPANCPKSFDVPLLELQPDDCRWPTTTDSPYLFCGHAKQLHSSYCPFHTWLSQPVSLRKAGAVPTPLPRVDTSDRPFGLPVEAQA